MADFTGAQYTVDEVLAGIKKNQITGLPPSNLTVKSVRVGDGKATISWSVPAKTVVDGQVLQTTGGIMIRRKLGEAPRSITDGDQVLISTDTVGSFEDNGLVNDQEYFYRFFPFSDHGVYNLNPENVVSAVPKAYVLYGFTIDKNNSDPAGRSPTPTWPWASLQPGTTPAPAPSSPAAGRKASSSARTTTPGWSRATAPLTTCWTITTTPRRPAAARPPM